MNPSRLLAVILFVIAMVTPGVIWALLAIFSRRSPGLLLSAQPVLKVLAWTFYLAAGLCCLAGVFGIPSHQTFFKIFPALTASSGGMNLVYGWVRRKVDPSAFHRKPDSGWWPAKREF